MAWVTITTNDIDEVLSSTEKGVVTSAHLGNTSVDEVIALIVAQVRGYAAKCTSLPTETDTIPESLKLTALILIRHTLVTRLAGSEALISEIRMQEYQNAVSYLRDVGRCQFLIEPASPCTPDTEVDHESGSYGGCELQDFACV